MAVGALSKNAGDGITGGYAGDSLALRVVIGAFTAVAWYNALELLILIFVTFKKYHGLYFWSLLVASVGVIFYGLGFLSKFFDIIENEFVNCVFITIGWWSMVTGQSVVLYSRLHLIVQNERLLKRILWMIIIDAIILHIPTTVLTFGSNSTTDTAQFVHGYNVMEKIQMTGFMVQEFIISGIYLWECVKFLRTDSQKKTRKTLYELFCINLIIIVMDLSLLGLEYANLYILEIVIKGMVYSIKLKLEFAILGKLVQYVKIPSGQFRIDTYFDDTEIGSGRPSTTGTLDPIDPIAVPRPAHKRQGLGNLTAASQITFEHVEMKNGNMAATVQYEPLRGETSRSGSSSTQIFRDDTRNGEDDIEQMMKRYSVSQ